MTFCRDILSHEKNLQDIPKEKNPDSRGFCENPGDKNPEYRGLKSQDSKNPEFKENPEFEKNPEFQKNSESPGFPEIPEKIPMVRKT